MLAVSSRWSSSKTRSSASVNSPTDVTTAGAAGSEAGVPRKIAGAESGGKDARGERMFPNSEAPSEAAAAKETRIAERSFINA